MQVFDYQLCFSAQYNTAAAAAAAAVDTYCLCFQDFTFVCPTEIIAFSERAKQFEQLNCQLIAASTDTEETHLAWIKTPRKKGGLGNLQIPIMADTTKVNTQYCTFPHHLPAFELQVVSPVPDVQLLPPSYAFAYSAMGLWTIKRL